MSNENHNGGQGDGAKPGTGNANPPHSATEEFFSFGDDLKKIHSDNAEYWGGFNHSDGQKK